MSNRRRQKKRATAKLARWRKKRDEQFGEDGSTYLSVEALEIMSRALASLGASLQAVVEAVQKYMRPCIEAIAMLSVQASA